MTNAYFELTREFNRHGTIAVLSSGQAVVYYRLAIMSKDGDWIVRETPEACERVRAVLSSLGARHRPAAPLDVRWLSGGWSSHFEYSDQQQRRLRCDFVSRPPRVPSESLEALFRESASGDLQVIDRTTLLRLKQTGRAKDYAVIGELARQLPAEEELVWTTDVDRILDLAPRLGGYSSRPSVHAAATGASRAVVVSALAQEIDELQLTDRRRISAYAQAAEPYLAAFRQERIDRLPLDEAHARACRLAATLLPQRPWDPTCNC